MNILKPLGCLLAVLWLAAPASADDEAAQLQKLMAARAPSIVTIKAVLRAQSRSSDQGGQEIRLELQGVLVDRQGLIMTANTPFSVGRIAEIMGAGDSSDDPAVSLTPVDFKVLFAGDDREYNAFLAARDTRLDLAFLKVEDLGDAKLTPVEFAHGAEPTIGQEVISISRLRRGYDYAPFFDTARLSGAISRPRRAWTVAGGVAGFGLPAYNVAGEVVGVFSTVEPGVKSEPGDSTAGFSRFVAMAGGQGPVRAFILPAHTVEGVITQAQKRAAQLAAERATRKPPSGTPEHPAPGAGTSPPGGKKPSPRPPAGRQP